MAMGYWKTTDLREHYNLKIENIYKNNDLRRKLKNRAYCLKSIDGIKLRLKRSVRAFGR